MKWKELTKTFMIISTLKKDFWVSFSALNFFMKTLENKGFFSI